jgi:pterin-4a-carbinolamine dehydratase
MDGAGPATVFATVVVPTRNRRVQLERALASVLAQNLPDWEAVVVDDGDGEGLEVAAALDDPRVSAVPSAGRGVADARTTGIERARGDLLCWLDDDDWWEDPGHLSLLAREAAAGAAFCYRGGWLVHEPGGEREPFDLAATPASLRRDNTILTSSLAYRADLHRTLGPLDPDTGGYCDWDFIVRMCDAGHVPRKLPGLGVCYSVHAASLSATVTAPARVRGFEHFARKHGLDIVISNHVGVHRRMSVPEGWSEVDGALQREFELADFPAAIAFVGRVAELAESENHHPDISIAYRKVTLRWSTHSAGGITDRDRELAARSAALA